jgi:hypothetical protein
MVQDYKTEVDRIATQDKKESFAIMDAVTNEDVNTITLNNTCIDYINSNTNTNTVSNSDSSLEYQEPEKEQAIKPSQRIIIN